MLEQSAPADRDGLYLLAVSQRYLNRIPAALQTLERLQHAHPQFSRLYQERGHCHVTQRDAPRAIEAYLSAVNLNPALPASWSKLEALYRMVGDQEHAAMAAGHVATLAGLPPEIVTATALFSDGEFDSAEKLVRSFLNNHDGHIEALRLLARIAMAQGFFDDAEALLATVLAKVPDYTAARLDYARVLMNRHKHSQAQHELAGLLNTNPDNREIKTLHATALVGVGQFEAAIGIYQELLRDAPGAAELHLSIAHAHKALGHGRESIDAYHAAVDARASFGEAYWSLANLKTYRFSDREVEIMRSQESSPGIGLADHYHLCFALGKALEDRGTYADSYQYYQRGNALKGGSANFRMEPIERNTRLQKQFCTRQFFAERAGWGAPSPSPIFIIGLPRSGSTLLEQILASHSQVEGTHELADVPRMVHELQLGDPDPADPGYPRVLTRFTAGDFRALGEKYLRETQAYRTGKPYFIDKMPNNFRHLALIRLMLPNAKIIDARREPMACCFSNFKQLFASGQEFTYSINDVARYYRTYLELMTHWNSALPGWVHRIIHEDVVADLEGSVRRLLEFCGLPFESRCVEFHRTDRSIRTASSEQVRQPIFREGLDQWKHFGPWLGPLKEALGDALSRYRDP
ncbi:MAG: sulfotransferase [Proteobacteria bacterium]|nr:sulfotransferase [Pseudomonadota bacterium]